MNIECPKCHKKYNVEDAYIPIGGAPIKCPNCGNIFGIYVEPIDIPMTPIEEDIPAPAENVQSQEQTNQSVQQDAPAAQPKPVIDHSYGMGETEEKPPSSELGALGTLGQNEQEEPSPDLGSMMDQQTSDTPDLGALGQSEATSPDMGSFGNLSPEPQQTTQPSPELGSTPDQQVSDTPDLGALGQSEATSPDMGSFGNLSPEPQQTTQPSPELNNAQQQTGIEKAQPSTDAQQETEEVQKAGKRKVGGTLFESLLAGFTLPANFKNLPDNVQKNHKTAVKLARQLAKDILLYHKDDVERGLQNGNIKDVLKEEIEKSFKFYSQRVEPDILEQSNYFKEALNKIIAKGDQVF